MKRILTICLVAVATACGSAQNNVTSQNSNNNSQNSNDVESLSKVQYGPACVSIQSYGGDANGTVDNVTPLTDALAALGTTGGCISFPPGSYYFSTNVSYTVGTNQGVQLVGSGSQSTILNGKGLSFAYTGANSSVSVRNLTLSTSSNSGNLVGLALAPSAGWPSWWPKAPSLIEDVIISATGAGNWTQGMSLQGLSNIRVIRTHIQNATTGTYVNGGSNVGNIQFQNCQYGQATTGLEIADYVANITVDTCGFGTDTGILVNSTNSALGTLLVITSAFVNTTACINMTPAVTWGKVNLVNNVFGGEVSGSQVNLSKTQWLVITNNQFGAPDIGTGLTITESSNGIVSGNSFAHLVNGINLTASASGINVQSNVYDTVTTPVSNAGTGNTVGGASSFSK